MASSKALPVWGGIRHVAVRHSTAIWLIVALGVLSRLPFQSRFLYHWDSINFALALEHFDVAAGQPHAPGYLLYVLLGRAAAWLMGGPQPGMVLLAVVGSALAAAALYDLGRRMWDARVGWIAALLLLTSPLFWFYGEVALPHTLDALAVIVAAGLCWRVWQGERRMALVLAVWLGLAGGFRPQTLVFLFPLAVVACSRLPWRWMFGATLVLGVTVLAWLVPLFALSGGMQEYLSLVASYSDRFNRSTSVFLGAGWAGVSHNLDKLVRYTIWGWAFGGLLAALGLWWLRRPLACLRDWRCWFLLLWAAPCLLFYTLIHMGQQGLIFVYLPILALLSAWASVQLIDHWRWGMLLVGACLIANALLFLLAPSHLLPGRFKVLSQATIAEHDELIQAQIAAVRSDLPTDAVLLAESWRFPEYYLPEVTLVAYERADEGYKLRANGADLVADAQVLAWYEPVLDQANQAAERTVVLSDHDGVSLRVLRRSANETFFLTPEGFGVN